MTNKHSTVHRRTFAVQNIAQRVLQLRSLKAQGSDDTDFIELALWNIEEALNAAYDAGHENRYYDGREDERIELGP